MTTTTTSLLLTGKNSCRPPAKVVDVDHSIMSRLNPLFIFVLRTPFHFLLSPGLMLITVTGRKTGRRYTIPVGYQRIGDTIMVMVAEARKKQWWRNYREPGPIEICLRGRTSGGQAEVVPAGSDSFREQAERTLRRVPGMTRVFGVDFDRKAGLTDEQLLHLSAEIAVVRIRLDPAAH